MDQDRIRYLEEAIRSTEKQLEMLKMNRRIDPRLLDSLNRQRLHFHQELAKLKATEQISKSGLGIFGFLDALDEEEVIRIQDNTDQSKPKSN
jgi:dolichyl-phosphate-mannose--protein O-mannosyl transferase